MEKEKLLIQIKHVLSLCNNWVKTAQNPDGGLPSDMEGSYSCAWTTSRLLWATWVAGVSFNEFYMRKALCWVLKNRNEDGGIPIVTKGDYSITDATAQTAISCALALGDTKENKFFEGLKDCITWILYNQIGSRGWNWRTSNEEGLTVTTAFAIYALKCSRCFLKECEGEIDNAINSSMLWLKNVQNADGGWGSYPGQDSRAANTSLVSSLLIDIDKSNDYSKSIGFIVSAQRPDGSWPDTIDRPTGHSITRFGTAYSLKALSIYNSPETNCQLPKAFLALLNSFDKNRFRYKDSDMLSWPTADAMLALASLGENLGVNLCRKTPFDIPLQGKQTSLIKSHKENMLGDGDEIFELAFNRVHGREWTVYCKRKILGELKSNFLLPYDSNELEKIFQCINLVRVGKSLSVDSINSLIELEVIEGVHNSSVKDILESIGRKLFQCIFSGEVGTAFKVAFNQAREESKPLRVQFNCTEEFSEILRCPWELLHDNRRYLVSNGTVELTRYVSYPESINKFSLKYPLKILYVSSRPKDLDAIPNLTELEALTESFREEIKREDVVVSILNNATYDSLVIVLENDEFDVIHFDCFGTHGKKCKQCGMVQYFSMNTCLSCGADISKEDSLGFIVMEGDSNQADFIDSIELQNVIASSFVKLVFLSSCQTSTFINRFVFKSLGASLIQAGIPVVVAMQDNITPSSATKFIDMFYTNIRKYGSPESAVASGRKAIYRSGEWYVPTLWVRK